MLRSHMDHMAITAPSLEAGVEYIRQTLGVSPQVGGEHPRMGTHNAVLKLGEKFYLEVIAINPNVPRPNRPRWFQLDEPDPSQPIRLATWIARTDDIYAAATASPIPLGEVEPMSRGQMNWLITIPADGGLPLHGIAPTLIQWSAGVHPAATLQESGCALVRALRDFIQKPRRLSACLSLLALKVIFVSLRRRQTKSRTLLPIFRHPRVYGS